MATVASLDVNLGVRTRQFTREMRGAQRTVQNFQRQATGAFRAAAFAAGAATAAFTALSRQFIQQADDLAKTARNAGVAVEAFQELSIVYEQAGLSSGGFTRLVQASSRAVVEAGNGSQSYVRELERIGLRYEDLINLSPEESLERIRQGIAALPTAAERTAAGLLLLQRGGRELGTVLELTSDDIVEQRRRLQELGAIIPRDILPGFENFNDRMDDASRIIRAQFLVALGEAFPDLNNADDLLRALGDTVREVTTAVVQFAQALYNNRDIILSVLGGIAAARFVTGLYAAGQAIVAITTAVRLLGVALLANPILALVAGIVSIGSTVIGIRIFGSSEPEFNEDEQARIRAAGDAAVRAVVQNPDDNTGFRTARNRAEEAERERIREERLRAREQRNQPTTQTPELPSGGAPATTGLSVSVMRQLEDRRLAFSRFLEDQFQTLTDSELRRQEFERRATDLRIEADRLEADATGETAEASRALAMDLREQATQLDRVAEGIGSFGDSVANVFDDLQDGIANAIAQGRFEDIGGLIVGTLQTAIQDRVSDALSNVLDGLFDALFSALGFGGGRANGGRVNTGTTYLVGEEGPELFTTSSPGNIIPNSDLIGGAGAGTINQTIQITGNVDEATRRAIQDMSPQIANNTRAVFAEQGILR